MRMNLKWVLLNWHVRHMGLHGHVKQANWVKRQILGVSGMTNKRDFSDMSNMGIHWHDKHGASLSWHKYDSVTNKQAACLTWHVRDFNYKPKHGTPWHDTHVFTLTWQTWDSVIINITSVILQTWYVSDLTNMGLQRYDKHEIYETRQTCDFIDRTNIGLQSHD